MKRKKYIKRHKESRWNNYDKGLANNLKNTLQRLDLCQDYWRYMVYDARGAILTGDTVQEALDKFRVSWYV